MTGCEYFKCKWWNGERCLDPGEYVNPEGDEVCGRIEDARMKEERASPGKYRCEGCGETFDSVNPDGHTRTVMDKDGNPEAMQCGPISPSPAPKPKVTKEFLKKLYDGARYYPYSVTGYSFDSFVEAIRSIGVEVEEGEP